MLKNILANWSNIILSALSVFVLYPFFVKTVGEDQYGVWLLIASIVGYFALIQLGVPLANVRFVSKYYAQGDYYKLNEVLGANIFLFSLMAVFTLIVGLLLSYFLEFFFQIPLEFLRYAKLALIIASFEIAVRFLFEVVEGVLHARQEFIVINIVRNILIVVRVLLSFLLVDYGHGLLWIAVLLLFTAIVESLLFAFYVKRRYPQLKFAPHIASKKVLSEIFGYSGFVLLFQLASRISFQTDALVLASVVSVASVVWFGVANSLLLYLTQLIVGVSNVLMPKISELDALNETEAIRVNYLRVTRITGLFVFPICLSLHLYGGDFIQLWMGDNYREISKYVLSVLALGYSFFLVQRGVGFPVLMGMSKMKWPTLIMFVGALVNLLLSIWWGRLYGISGVAWGTACPTILVAFLLMFYISSLLRISIATVAYESLLLPLFSLLPLYFGYLVAAKIVHFSSYPGLIAKVFITSIICLMGLFFFLKKQDKNQILSLLKYRKGYDR